MPIYTLQGPDGKTYDVEGPAGATAEQLGAFIQSQGGKPTRESPSLARSFVNGIPKGAAGFLDTFNNLPENLMNLGKMAVGTGATAMGRPDLAPNVTQPTNTFSDMATRAGLINPQAEPTSVAGRMVDMAGQAIGGGGINPAALARNMGRGAALPIARDFAAAGASGLGAGAALEGAKMADVGSDAGNAALQTSAALLGAGIPGTVMAARGTAGDRAAAALQGVTPQQLAMAEALSGKARAAGAPLTGYEAIQAQTGLNPKMQTQQRIAEGSDAAASSGLTGMMQARPGANAALAEQAFSGVAPRDPRPDALAGRLRSTAEQAITDARQAGNAQAAPYYARTTGNANARIPASDWNTLTADPLVQKALAAVKSDPVYGQTNAQPGQLSWLDAAKKWMDDKAGSAKMGGENNAARMYTGGTKAVTGSIDPTFPDYAKARGIVAQNMNDVVKPMQEGQIGKLSRSDDFGAQMASFLPEKPLDITPGVIDQTVGTLGKVDSKIVPEMLAQHLRGTFNESNGGGIANNPMGGYNFAKKVADNPGQRANLIEALQASGKSPREIMDALDIFQAQGMKPAVNSATMANAAESSAMSGNKMLDTVTKPLGSIGRMSDAWRNGWATKALAEALAAPDSVKRLQELSRTNGKYDPVKQQALANLLMSSRVPQQQEAP